MDEASGRAGRYRLDVGKRKPGKQKGLDPERVADGRADVDVRTLLSLIHQVNPTERGLSRRATERAYALKSRLQSLLLRRFGDEIEIVEDGEPNGVVLLRHRYGGGDGAHALIAELDVEVRAEVQRRLDLRRWEGRSSDEAAEPPGTASTGRVEDDPRPLEALPADELLSRAEEAMEEYDYDVARSALKRALSFAETRARAAPLLLELLVERLGLDDEAAALEGELGRRLSRDPRVRGLLAMAAARRGERAHAVRLVEGLEEPRAAEVYAAVAEGALQAGELDAAQQAIEHVARIDPASAQIVRLKTAMAEHRAEAREPLERELAEAHAGDQLDRAERLASVLLARFPESEIGRRIAADLERCRRQARVRELCDAANAAEARGAVAEAAARLREALSLGSAPDTAAADLARLERVLEERRSEEQAQRIRKALDRGDRVAGFLAYLALDDAARARIRDTVAAPALRWIEEIGPSPTGSRARAAALAIEALERAQPLLAEGDPSGALELLEPHARLLRRVPDARAQLEQARAELARRRTRVAEQALSEARAALAEGDDERAKRALQSVDPGALSEPARALLEEARTERRRLSRSRRLAAELEHLSAAGELVAARGVAAELCELARPAARERWRARRDALAAEIRTAWKIESFEPTAEESEALSLSLARAHRSVFDHESTAAPWLNDAGDEAVFACARGRRLFVWHCSVPDARVTRALSLSAPEPLDEVIFVRAREERLELVFSSGHLLQIALPGGDVASWWRIPLVVGEHLEGAYLSDDGRWLWIWSTDDDFETTARVIDCARGEPHRDVGAVLGVDPAGGLDPPAVLVTDVHQRIQLCDLRGAPHRRHSLPSGVRALALEAHPSSSEALVVLARGALRDLEATPLTLVVCDRGGAQGEVVEIEGSNYELVHTVGVASSPAMAFVLLWLGRGRELCAFRLDERRIDRSWKLELVRDSILVRDHRSRHLVLVECSLRGLRMHRLGAAAPVPSASDPEPLPLASPFACSLPDDAEIEALYMRTTGLTGGEIASWAEAFREEHREDPHMLAALVHALHRAMKREEATKLEAWLFEHHRDDPNVAALALARHARSESWDELIAACERLEELGGALGVRHLHHAVGIALFRKGDLERAAAVWERGERHPGSCELGLCAELARRSLGGPPGTEAATAERVDLACRLLNAIRRADDHLSAGAFERAAAVLDEPDVALMADEQALSRRVEAELPISADTPARRFVKRLLVSGFVARGAVTVGRAGLPPPGRVWEDDRIQALSDRCLGWLESENESDPAPPQSGSASS